VRAWTSFSLDYAIQCTAGTSAANREARRPAGLRGDRAVPGYSPITLQISPIRMKKPLNIAMSPMPPYGELAPS
jgi:hypothetical protein